MYIIVNLKLLIYVFVPSNHILRQINKKIDLVPRLIFITYSHFGKKVLAQQTGARVE